MPSRVTAAVAAITSAGATAATSGTGTHVAGTMGTGRVAVAVSTAALKASAEDIGGDIAALAVIRGGYGLAVVIATRRAYRAIELLPHRRMQQHETHSNDRAPLKSGNSGGHGYNNELATFR